MVYAPGTEETDPKKQNMSLQANAAANLTNAADIAANTAAIAANTAAIAAISVPSAATQANQETATSTTVYVPPGRQQYHPSAAKAWVSFTGATGAILASYNVTSVTRTGAGLYTVNFTTAFSSANYAASFMAGGAGYVVFGNSNQLAASIDVRSQVAGVNTDVTQGFVICFGDQ